MRYDELANIIDDNSLDPKRIIRAIKLCIENESMEIEIKESLGAPSMENYETKQELERVLSFLVSFYLH